MSSRSEVPPARRPRVTPAIHPLIVSGGGYAWRLIGIGIVGLALLWLVRELRVVLFALVVAVIVARVLAPVHGWLRAHRWPPGLSAAVSVTLFAVTVTALVVLVVSAFVDEFDSIGPTLDEAVDDIQDWLVEDSPFPLSRDSVERSFDRAGGALRDALRPSEGATLDRATVAAEALTGVLLAVILTFFVLRDGARFVTWTTHRLRPARRARVDTALDRAWAALAGYLRGATLLGLVESAFIGAALGVTGGALVAPVMLLTFLGAYVPVLGAIAAAVMAVLVALVTGGTTSAVVVGLVALVVQQLDNDLLAPVIYGRALSLHPVVILVSVVAGGALFGLAGTVLAVPVVAVAVNAMQGYRSAPDVTSAAPGAPLPPRPATKPEG